MVPKQWVEKLTEILKRYRYAIIILLIGLLLMVLPNSGRNVKASGTELNAECRSPEEVLEQKLSLILSKVEGAGDVEVILTIAAGEETIFQTNDDYTDSDTASSSKVNTVTVTNSNRDQTGLVKQVKNAIYKGAIVVCHGADDPSVHLALVDAISRITGLGANCISVLKMK